MQYLLSGRFRKGFWKRKRDLWMAFVDLERAFDRVPMEVVWWALKRLGVEEWLVPVIIAEHW